MMSLMSAIPATSTILITCPKRITPYLKREVEHLNFAVQREVPTGVVVRGTMHDAMRLNLALRTAHRVLFQLKKFYVPTPDDLYKSLSTLAWEDIIPTDGYVSVLSSVATETINNNLYANVKAKDAIVDRIRRKCGTRPDSGPETDRSVVFLYWNNRDCYVYLDTSGEPLSKRGYRTMPWKAPMRETLAAASILASRWDGRSTFLNPMCGSGTLAIEAALIALGKPPATLRTNFGFMHLLGYDETAWKTLREQALAQSRTTLNAPIIASDISADAVAAAQHNARSAGVEQLIRFEVGEVGETSVPPADGAAAVVMLNPEYGERMGSAEEAETMHKRIGDFFKQRCSGYTGYIFTGNLGAAKKVGLKATRRVEFYNADIDCRLLEYELYEGTKRFPSPSQSGFEGDAGES